MRHLKQVLDSVLADSKFDLGKVEQRRKGLSITYRRNQDEMVFPDELQNLAVRLNWEDDAANRARRAKIIVPDEAFSRWLSATKELLSDYINEQTGKIGHTFPMESSRQDYETFEASGVTSQSYISRVDDFAKVLIRGAAILGIARLVEMLGHWIEERAVHYRTSAVLNGLYVNARLAPLPGIRIEPLPRSTDGVFGSLPVLRGSSIEDYLGRTVLNIDSIARPAFFRPDDEGNGSVVQSEFVSGVGTDTVCQALALEANTEVEAAFEWNDYEEASRFLSPGSRSSRSRRRGGVEARGIGVSLRTNHISGVRSVSIDEQKISDLSADSLKSILLAMSGQEEASVGVAISRWCKSKEGFRTLADQFIDLRIALEALYLKNFDSKNRGEMKFRLVLFAAWYVGLNLEERKQIRETLSKAYDMGSMAVHGALVPSNVSNRALLSKSQELCRKGILKFLEEAVRKDWADLILGAGLENAEHQQTR